MLADRLKTLAPSSTLAVQAKAKELRARGIDVISFGAPVKELVPPVVAERLTQKFSKG